MNTRGVVDRVLAGVVPKRCPACGKKPELYGEDTADGRFKVSAYCHGAYTVKFLDPFKLKSIRPDGFVDDLLSWTRGLFALDCLPDVKELLFYNQGKLPG